MNDPVFHLYQGTPDAGRPLPEKFKCRMERLFQTDLSRIRIHVGNAAPQLGARAVTHGNDIYFAPGAYCPDTGAGLHLLAHELTHVLQQAAGRVKASRGLGPQMVLDGELEHEADQYGLRAAEPSRLVRRAQGTWAGPTLPAGIELSAPRGSSAVIQPALAKQPIPVTVAEMVLYYDTHQGGWAGAFGKTETPTLSRPPRLDGMTVIGAADPGTNMARYVGMGIHESNSVFDLDLFVENASDDRNLRFCTYDFGTDRWNPAFPRLYYVLSAEVAQTNRACEAEHLKDHQVAFDRTLGLLERTLREISKQGVVSREIAQNKQRVVAMLEEKMRVMGIGPNELMYAKNGLDVNAWAQQYAALVGRSRNRDTQGWHQFDLTYIDPTRLGGFDGLVIHSNPNLPAPNPNAPTPVYLEVVKSPTIEQGVGKTFDQIPI